MQAKTGDSVLERPLCACRSSGLAGWWEARPSFPREVPRELYRNPDASFAAAQFPQNVSAIASRVIAGKPG